MELEGRGRVRRSHARSNWKQEDLDACDRRAVWSGCLPDGSRVRRESHARFCERPVVKFRRPTHPGLMTSIFAIDKRGTSRLTICIGPWALKLARNATGRRCNRFEADLWNRTTAARRNMLGPVLARLPFGLAIFMPRAQPFSQPATHHLIH